MCEVLSKTEVKKRIVALAKDAREYYRNPNGGQIIIHTNIFQWKDGTYRVQRQDLCEHRMVKIDGKLVEI